MITKANLGGAQRYVRDLAFAYHKDNEVVVAHGSEGALTRSLKDEGVRTRTIPYLERDIGLYKEIRAFFALTHIIREEKPEVLHLNSGKAALFGAIAGTYINLTYRLRGKNTTMRIIFTAHAWAFNEDRNIFAKALLYILHYITVLLSHDTITVSDALRRGLRGPGIAKKMHTVYLGVDTQASLLRQTEARALLSECHGAVCGNPCIITIAELHPIKRIGVLLEAFHTLLHQSPEATLLIMGEGEEYETLERKTEKLGIQKQVFFLGYVEGAGRLVSAADIFVLPSKSEALGYVLLEAGLAGVAVLATNVGGIPEVLDCGKGGVLVPPDDVHALAKRLRRLSEDAELREEKRKALQSHILEQFALERMTTRTWELYQKDAK